MTAASCRIPKDCGGGLLRGRRAAAGGQQNSCADVTPCQSPGAVVSSPTSAAAAARLRWGAAPAAVVSVGDGDAGGGGAAALHRRLIGTLVQHPHRTCAARQRESVIGCVELLLFWSADCPAARYRIQQDDGKVGMQGSTSLGSALLGGAVCRRVLCMSTRCSLAMQLAEAAITLSGAFGKGVQRIRTC